MKCPTTSQIDAHLAAEDELQREHEWKQQWIQEQAEEAFDTLSECGTVWTGDYTVIGHRRVYYELMDFLESETATSLINSIIFNSMQSNYDAVSEKTTQLEEELKSSLVEHFEKRADQAYRKMLDERDFNN